MDSFDKLIAKITAIGTIVTMISGGIMFGTNRFENKIRKVVKEETLQIKEQMILVSEYIDYQKIKNIEKQHAKIINDNEDVKNQDIEQAINDWKFIPEKYKTTKLVYKYNAIELYYAEKILKEMNDSL